MLVQRFFSLLCRFSARLGTQVPMSCPPFFSYFWARSSTVERSPCTREASGSKAEMCCEHVGAKVPTSPFPIIKNHFILNYSRAISAMSAAPEAHASGVKGVRQQDGALSCSKCLIVQ